jgi:hypothetical protein
MSGHANGPQIMHGESGLESSMWFERTSEAVHVTQSGTDPLNIKSKMGRLEIIRQFFSVRLISNWNKLPADKKEQAWLVSRQRTNSYKRTQRTLPNTQRHRRPMTRPRGVPESDVLPGCGGTAVK